MTGRKQTLYSTLRPTFHNLGNAPFVPEYDGSHNMAFACEKCTSKADVLEVRFDDRSGGSFYFWLGCPSCGATGLRKLYLSSSISHHHPTIVSFKVREKRENTTQT
jgi:hypothetical protein